MNVRPETAVNRRQFLNATVSGVATALSASATDLVAQTTARAKVDDGVPKPKHRTIDVHCHPRWIGHNGAKTVENMDAAGIEQAWLISWELPEREMSPGYYATLNPTGRGIQFRDVIDVAEGYPGRFIPGTTVDPRDPHAHERLKAAVDIHKVRVFGEFKLRMRYDDPDAIRLFHYCGELALPVLFHLDTTFPRHGVGSSRQWWYGGGIECIESALKLCPKTQFLGHAPAFWREISGDADKDPAAYPKGPIVGRGRLLEFLDKYLNLNCDLSAGSGHGALSRDLEFTRKFLTDYQDRCFFGRDEFTNKLHDLLVSLSLPDDVMKKILGGNALRLVPV